MDEPEQLNLFDDPLNFRANASHEDPVGDEAKSMRVQIEIAREARNLSKADLARLLDKNPAAVRRLLTTADFNPELRTLIQVSEAVGLKLELVRPRRRYRKRDSS